MSGSIIRSVTRGTDTVNGSKTISCTIIDTNKVIVLLDVNGECGYTTKTCYSSGATGVYLSNVSTTGITVMGKGFEVGSQSIKDAPIDFSYQIIEFM